ncbi:hypothetical protein D1007_30172 [Hordeum vulgare]|nr:hypothetical protein D1007_30172 [Hordeum vulgare]
MGVHPPPGSWGPAFVMGNKWGYIPHLVDLWLGFGQSRSSWRFLFMFMGFIPSGSFYPPLHHLKIIHVKDDKVKPEATSDEHHLTEYEKVRSRNMMRNNRIFQSLGIDAIASMIRKTNDVQEGTTNGVQEGSGVISDDPEYNPKEDEVVVHKTVKALKTASKKRKSSEASAAMPPGRVMAPPPGQTKRILEPDEPDRVTRQKATMAASTDHQESPLGMDFESSVEMRDEFL